MNLMNYTPPKTNIEPENDGVGSDDFPKFQGGPYISSASSQVATQISTEFSDDHLGGGNFKYFLFSPRNLGKMNPF